MSVVQFKKEQSLDDLVIEIRDLLLNEKSLQNRANKKRLEAGQRLHELKARVEAGEAGDVSWWAYYDKHLAGFRSRKDAEKLLKIAAAEDPESAAEEAAQRNREHQAKYRAKHDAAYVSGKPTADEGDDCPVPDPDALEIGKLFARSVAKMREHEATMRTIEAMESVDDVVLEDDEQETSWAKHKVKKSQSVDVQVMGWAVLLEPDTFDELTEAELGMTLKRLEIARECIDAAVDAASAVLKARGARA
jgi:hypothetical protein